MLKSQLTGKLLSLVLTFSFAAASLTPVFSQTSQTAIAELTVNGRQTEGKAPTILINGSNSANGSRLAFPAQISVPAETSAIVSFGKAGKLELAPGTMANIAYSETGVSVDLSEGRLLVSSAAESVFNIKTVDGIIANDKSRETIFITEIVGGATGVNTETGTALVNGVPVRAGEVWTADPSKKFSFASPAKTKKSSRKSKFWLVALGAAIGAGVAVAITAAND